MSDFIKCPKCKINAAREIAKGLPNTTKGGVPVDILFCKHCKHHWISEIN